MLNLSPEIAVLRPPDAEALLARERREIFSIHPELRAMSWGGVLLIATGVAILLAKHYERVGPLAPAVAVGAVAAAAYGYAIWRKGSEYALLLGALLLSADLAFIEGQFHLLDHGWPRHLLILAVIHALTAYLFDSRTLLSLSITALAAWMGIEQRVETIFDSNVETAIRAMLCAAIVLLWSGIDRRLRSSRSFDRVFEHFAANLALFAGVVLAAADQPMAILLTVSFAIVTAWHGFRVRAESFVLYAYAYAFLAVVIVVVNLLHEDMLVTLFLIVASVVAIAGLFAIHVQFRRRTS